MNKHKTSSELNKVLIENFDAFTKSTTIEKNINKAVNNQIDQYTNLLVRRMN